MTSRGFASLPSNWIDDYPFNDPMIDLWLKSKDCTHQKPNEPEWQSNNSRAEKNKKHNPTQAFRPTRGRVSVIFHVI